VPAKQNSETGARKRESLGMGLSLGPRLNRDNLVRSYLINHNK